MKRFFIVFFSCFLFQSLHAQQLVTIDTIKVFDSTGKPMVSSKNKVLNLQGNGIFQENIAEIIKKQAPIFVKSYGIGSLATLNLRGSSAHHTKMYLNGFELNSPMIGMYDFSLIQSGFFSNAEIHYGGASLIDGHGGLGGSVALQSTPSSREEKVTFSTEWSSLNETKMATSIGFKHKNGFGKAGFFNNQAKNNFKLPDGANLLNANLAQSGVFVTDFTQISNSQALLVTAILQQSQRELPAPIGGIGRDFQADWLGFFQFKYSYYFKKNVLEVKTGLVYDKIEYRFVKTKPENPTSSQSFKNQIRLKNKQEKLKTEIGILHDYSFLTSQFYDNQKVRNRIQLIGSLQYQIFENLSLEVLNKTEMIDNFIQYFVPLTGFKLLINKDLNLNLKSSYARNFHYPTLNDLYWIPGGNPNLKPEVGETFEVGFEGFKSLKNWHIDFGLTGFYSEIDNWVQWVPTSSIIWSPRNVKSVQTNGVEGNIKLQFQKSNFKVLGRYQFTFQRAINKSVYNSDINLVNKQLIYNPNFVSNFQLTVHFKNLSFNSFFSHTSGWFINQYNTREMPAYQILDVNLSRKFTTNQKQNMGVQFGVENALNSTYQVIYNRPMPPRIYRISIQFNLNKP